VSRHDGYPQPRKRWRRGCRFHRSVRCPPRKSAAGLSASVLVKHESVNDATETRSPARPRSERNELPKTNSPETQ
jgi:hypothetical protein